MKFFANKLDLTDIRLTAEERNKWTPDAVALEQAAFHLFFAHDRLQQGFPEHDKLIADYIVYGAIGFTDEKFVMQKSMLGRDTYPVIQRKDYTFTPPSRIKGQLFYLMQEEFRNLDSVMRNGIEFRRELINIYIPYFNLMKLLPLSKGGRHKEEYQAIFGTEHPSVPVPKNKIVRAYCYVGIDEYWDGLYEPKEGEGEKFDGISAYSGWHNVTRYLSHREDVGYYYHFTKRELFDKRE